jgi:hypothetical protein
MARQAKDVRPSYWAIIRSIQEQNENCTKEKAQGIFKAKYGNMAGYMENGASKNNGDAPVVSATQAGNNLLPHDYIQQAKGNRERLDTEIEKQKNQLEEMEKMRDSFQAIENVKLPH